jgi:chemotaxis signal transduction protein
MRDESIEGEQFTGETNSEESARKVQLFRTGAFAFGVFENEVATIADWREPTPLPHAPESILGVVSIQGRMLTLLNPAFLAGGETFPTDGVYRKIIALRGDEQLALAATEIHEIINHSSTERGKADHQEKFVVNIMASADSEFRILNVSELFPAALRGRERRRRRF